MNSPEGNPSEVQNPGSPASGEPVFLAVGRFGKPHGVRGEISMQVVTDFPERFTPGTVVFVGPQHQALRLQSVRGHKNRLIIGFEDFSDRDSVGALRGQWVFVKADDRPELPEGEYYHHELLGLELHSLDGEVLGPIKEIIQTGAIDVFVLCGEDGKELLIPASDEVIQEIDLEAGVIHVQLIPGLR